MRAAAFDRVEAEETVVIVGTAPSLKEVDVDRLAGLPSISCNSIMRHPTFRPKYWVIGDRGVYVTEKESGRIAEFAPQVALLLSSTIWDEKIQCRDVAPQEKPSVRMYEWRVGTCRTPFQWDTLADPLCSFATTAGPLLQMAVIMGAKRVVSVGIDLKAPPAGTIHFYEDGGNRTEACIQDDGETMGPAATWVLFRKARDDLERMGIPVLNLSPVTDSAFASVFGNYDFEQFCEEEGI